MNVSNWSFESEGVREPVVASTDVLVELCGLMDFQVIGLSFFGFLFSLWCFFWFGRVKYLFVGKYSEAVLVWFDKAHLMVLALLFAMIFVRALRMG